MEQIKSKLKENRPALKDNSIATYVSSIINFLKKGGKQEIENAYEFLRDNVSEVFKMGEEYPLERRKTIYSALTVLFDDITHIHEQYSKKVLELRKELTVEYAKQEKTEKQEKNWVTQEEIKKVYEQMEKDVTPLLKSHDTRTRADFVKIQDFVILSLYVLQPPRRNEDYLKMRQWEPNKEIDNYYTKTEMVFNQYKNSNTKGQQCVPLSKKLLKLLNVWREIQTSPYLLILTKSGVVNDAILENGKEATGTTIRASLNRTFGKNVSVNILRHSILSESIPINVIKSKQLTDNMGTSFNTALNNYVKIE
jgi:hypothetical protein